MRLLTLNDDTSAFGINLTKVMNEVGIDDHQLASLSGLSYSTVRTLRRAADVNPTADSIAKLAKGLNVNPQRLQVNGVDSDRSKHAAAGRGNGDKLDPVKIRVALRELEKLPEVAAYRALTAALAA